MIKHKLITTLCLVIAILILVGCTIPPQETATPPVALTTVPPASESAAGEALPASRPAASVASPAKTTAAFYTWYLDYVGALDSETRRNPLVDGAYRASPYLTQSFVGHIDQLLAEMREQDRGGYDPFLCAQDVPMEMTPAVTFVRNDMASVVVHSSFPNHVLTVDLQPEGEGWLISNITCAGDPVGVALAFYTWYLGYIGDRSAGDFRNPLVDQAYHGHPLLSEDLVQEVDAVLAGFDRGGYDPFLLAQDIPQNFSVDPGVVDGTAVVHLQFGPSSVRHLLVTMDDSRRKITTIVEDAGLSSEAPTDERLGVGGDITPATGASDYYGFSFDYPGGWVLQAEPLGGPGMPEDWPVQAMWFLMPQEVADTLASRSGAPDPNAPVIVAPFQIEVVVGDQKAMERVYFNFTAGEPALINNHNAIVLRGEPGYANYVFPHPRRPETWVIFTDWVTEFPGREAQGAIAAPVLPGLLASLVFSE
jgi:hypothetical protein